jgi:antitoxin Phd
MATSSLPTPTGESTPMSSFPASELKNSSADVLEKVLTAGAVVITRHDKEKAVILSIETYRRLLASRRDDLAVLHAKFGGLLAKLQTPAARRGARDAFDASPEDLGKAAVKAARRRG